MTYRYEGEAIEDWREFLWKEVDGLLFWSEEDEGLGLDWCELGHITRRDVVPAGILFRVHRDWYLCAPEQRQEA